MTSYIKLTINGEEVQAAEGATILQAAQQASIYIPTLCSHPDLPPSSGMKGQQAVFRGGNLIQNDDVEKQFEGCQLCLVEVEGKEGFSKACSTPVSAGMVIKTDSPQLKGIRQDKLMGILASHPHACLMCAQREGCAREPCSLKIEVNARCCPKFGRCELQNISEYIGIKQETPRFNYRNLPIDRDEPLFVRDYNICIGCLRCVRACKDLRGVEALGFVYRNGEVIVGTIAPSLKAAACRFCGACVEVCPTGALTDKGVEWAERKKDLVPCTSTCPVGVEVPRYVRLIAQGKFAEAAAVVRERLPLPTIVGYICPHPCEEKCRRAEVNEPIAICNIKRFAAEHDTGLWQKKVKASPPTGKRVAVVGSGPAGLTAAYYLSRLGHSVAILEALPQAGGMMRVGIPNYHLPRQVLDAEIDTIKKAGVEIRTNYKVESLDELFQQGYEAIMLAVGLFKSRTLPVPGIEQEGVLLALPFLRRVNEGQLPSIGRKVVVVGGGGVAIDVARCARRLKAEVELVCLEDSHQMPALPWDIAKTKEEGVNIHNCWGPKRILVENGRVTGVEMKRCTAVFDAQGRFSPCYDETITSILTCDTVILAIGQAADLELVKGRGLDSRGLLAADKETCRTADPRIFAGGDCVTGPASVVEAIAQGRQAAISIDKFLGGQGIIQETLVEAEKPNPCLGREEGFADKPRGTMPCLTMAQRLQGFSTVELGYPEGVTVAEAGRCLQCDLRLQISSVAAPPEKETWLKFTPENVEAIPELSGVYQILDEDKKAIFIGGVLNLRQEIKKRLEATQPPWDRARYFIYEQNDMFTAKESELLQQFLQVNGRMPAGNEELMDLF